ncbi:hypothetical protein [Streptomyces sp. NPDC046909]|uniref:hypothetical protein n=1 Tax=Streptomyces sp. NPDC046909 TaxID=3155617 RepID=UPI0034088608
MYYEDGTAQEFTLSSPDWAGDGGDVAIATAYRNRPGNTTEDGAGNVYYVGVPLQAGKTPVSVRLPDASATATPGTPALHVFAMTSGTAVPELTSTFNSVAVTQDDATGFGDIDGWGSSLSAQALAAKGVTAGGSLDHAGLGFTWPSTAGARSTQGTAVYGLPDNVVASGQTVAMDGTRGRTLGFLVTASYGPTGGTGTIRYADGSAQDFTLGSPDWFGGSGDLAVGTAYQNRQGNVTYDHVGNVYYVGVPLQAGKTPVSVRLPDASATAAPDTPTLHVFAMTRG